MDCPYCGELLQPEIRVHNIEDHGLTVCHKCNRTLVFEPPHGTFGEVIQPKDEPPWDTKVAREAFKGSNEKADKFSRIRYGESKEDFFAKLKSCLHEGFYCVCGAVGMSTRECKYCSSCGGKIPREV